MSVQLNEITLIVFDEKDNFNDETTKLRIAEELWNKVILVESKEQFASVYSRLEKDEKFVLACHVFHASDGKKVANRGVLKLLATNIEKDYGIAANLISSGESLKVSQSLHDAEGINRVVHNLTKLREKILLGEITVHTKRKISIQSDNEEKQNSKFDDQKPPQIDYGIITALYKDEFEQLKDYFEWGDDYSTGKKIYRFGELKADRTKKIVAAVPTNTGMVDSAIIATQMMELFRPKYILMSGVCGGHPQLKFGDIVLASKVFTFQKGKISDVRTRSKSKIRLFDAAKKLVDYDHLYDESGNQIKITIEKFEHESDGISIHSELKDILEPVLDNVALEINKDVESLSGVKVSIHFEPIACSTMVINKEGFFESNIKILDRKTAAVEMESYGVARATEIANRGNTRFVIFKSVMDNMTKKDDKHKKFAAKTSAMFLNIILRDYL